MRDRMGLSELVVPRVIRAGPAPCCALDLDGVLVDTDELHAVALNRALLPFEAHIGTAEHLARFKGLPTRVKCRMLVEEGRIPPHAPPMVEALKQRYTMELIPTVVGRAPEKLALLEALLADGWRLAICSNAVRRTVDALVAALGAANYVEFTLSNEDVTRPKPDGEMYLLAAERFGVAPGDLVVVEDAPNGRAAALAAGCRLVAVDGPGDVHVGMLPRLLAARPVAA